MRSENLEVVVGRLTDVCRAAAPPAFLADLRRSCAAAGLAAAVARRDTPALFDWLARISNFQGVSNDIAAAYLDQHGTIGWTEIAEALAAGPRCPKLRSFWDYDTCGFAKVAFTCSMPQHLASCPVPAHDLRNGRLNQSAYALFLFLRDVCGGDLVGWLDARLAGADAARGPERAQHLRAAVLDPLGHVYGVSRKVLSLALSNLLLGADPGRPLWVEAGAGMVVVDTLVHNWLHRTGTLRQLGAAHPYGAGCYAPGGCAAIVEAAAHHIDARRFCPEGPAAFPRLVQKAVWLFCAASGRDTCNGNRIDDARPCQDHACPVAHCARVKLR